MRGNYFKLRAIAASAVFNINFCTLFAHFSAVYSAQSCIKHQQIVVQAMFHHFEQSETIQNSVLPAAISWQPSRQRFVIKSRDFADISSTKSKCADCVIP